jgi:uncharacterized phage protein gp47/JayE
MALQQRTTQEIYDLIIAQMKSELGQNVSILPKSFISIIATVMAGVFMILYKSCNWFFLQMFVSTASYEEITALGKTLSPLVEWGRLIGVGDPTPATQSVVSVKVKVVQKENSIFSGTQFISTLNSLTYITTQSYTFKEDEAIINLTCAESGAKGNLSAGDTLNIVNSVSFIEDSVEVIDLIQVAVDKESESSYRKKIQERFQLQPEGGALSDYRNWANATAGVQNSFVYTGGAGEVIVYVLADSSIYEDRIPDKALLKKVGQNIDIDPDTQLATRRPVTAIIDPDADESYKNIRAVKLIEFDVEILSLEVSAEAEVKNLIKEAITDYFLEREPYLRGLSLPPAKNIINETNIIAIVDDIVKNYNGNFAGIKNLLNEEITSKYTLKEGEVAKLKSLKINDEVI